MKEKILNYFHKIKKSKFDGENLNFMRNLIKIWDEFREDSNMLISTYPEIKEKLPWILWHFDTRDKYFAYIYKLQNGKAFEDFNPLKPVGNNGYTNNLGHYLRNRDF